MHTTPDTQSSVIVKSIIQDNARSYYSGYIFVGENALNSESDQQSSALLFNDARAHAIPALEILTNDVQCKHGSAIGYINPDQLFYMQSRGLLLEQAELLIKNGFLRLPPAQHPEFSSYNFFDKTPE